MRYSCVSSSSQIVLWTVWLFWMCLEAWPGLWCLFLAAIVIACDFGVACAIVAIVFSFFIHRPAVQRLIDCLLVIISPCGAYFCVFYCCGCWLYVYVHSPCSISVFCASIIDWLFDSSILWLCAPVCIFLSSCVVVESLLFYLQLHWCLLQCVANSVFVVYCYPMCAIVHFLLVLVWCCGTSPTCQLRHIMLQLLLSSWMVPTFSLSLSLQNLQLWAMASGAILWGRPKPQLTWILPMQGGRQKMPHLCLGWTIRWSRLSTRLVYSFPQPRTFGTFLFRPILTRTILTLYMSSANKFGKCNTGSSRSFIERKTTYLGTPEHNGIIERKNCHLLEINHALLFTMHAP